MLQKNHFLMWISAFFSITLVCIAYSNHFYNSFHFDDFHVLVNNAYIQDLHNVKKFFTDTATASAQPSNQLYRPLFTLSLAIDYWLGHEVAPFWFHVSTFFWYLALCVLLYFFFLKITQATFPNQRHAIFSWLAATWYALHTAHAETINYISARSDSVSTFWLVAAFILYIYLPRSRKWGFYLVPLVVGALFKQTVLVFPGLLFLYVLFFEEQASFSKFMPLFNAFKKSFASLITCCLTAVFLIKMLPTSAHTGGGPLYQYLITQPYVIFHYFKTFFLPLWLSADTDFGLLTTMHDHRFLVGMLFMLASVFVILHTAKHAKTRPIAFGLAWFFIALLPTSLVPLAEVMNDHRIFFPFIGLLLAVAYSFYLFALRYTEQLQKERGLCTLLILMLFGTHAYGTYQRNEVWRTEASLWKDVSIKSPQNGRGLMNYGLTHMQAGRYDEAEKYFLRSLPLNPTYTVLHTNLGVLNAAKGNLQDAERYFEKGLLYGPNDPGVLYFYADFLNRHDRPRKAAKLLEKLVHLSPAHLSAQHLLAAAYLNISFEYYQTGHYEKTISESQKALKLKPDDAIAYNNICSAYVGLMQYDKAEVACLKALALKPDFTLAQNNLNDLRHKKET